MDKPDAIAEALAYVEEITRPPGQNLLAPLALSGKLLAAELRRLQQGDQDIDGALEIVHAMGMPAPTALNFRFATCVRLLADEVVRERKAWVDALREIDDTQQHSMVGTPDCRCKRCLERKLKLETSVSQALSSQLREIAQVCCRNGYGSDATEPIADWIARQFGALERERDQHARTQHWLDEFQGATATKEVELMQQQQAYANLISLVNTLVEFKQLRAGDAAAELEPVVQKIRAVLTTLPPPSVEGTGEAAAVEVPELPRYGRVGKHQERDPDAD